MWLVTTLVLQIRLYVTVNANAPFLYQVEDLSRMYRLFSKVEKGLEPVAGLFRQVCDICIFVKSHVCNDYHHLSTLCCMMQHITSEGTALIQQAEDAANNKVSILICFLSKKLSTIL